MKNKYFLPVVLLSLVVIAVSLFSITNQKKLLILTEEWLPLNRKKG